MRFNKTLVVLILSCIFVANSSYAKTSKTKKQAPIKVEEASESKQCREGNYDVCSKTFRSFLLNEKKVEPKYCPVILKQDLEPLKKAFITDELSEKNSDVWIDCVIDYGLRTCNSSEINAGDCAAAAFRAIKSILKRTDSDIRSNAVSELLPDVHSLLKKSCEFNNKNSCGVLGIIYDMFWVSPFEIYPYGIYLYRRDFLKNYEDIKGLEYTWGEKKGFQLDLVHSRLKDYTFYRDHFKAFELYKKACDLEFPVGCVNLGSMLENGDGTKRDLNAAYSYYEKACKLENGYGCKMQGLALEHGVGTSKDIAKATELYSKACDLKDQEGCDLYNKQTDYKPL